ncbi:MAG: energy-coupling factor transporter ATPase [Lachnospiraceae bacterium]|jgi:energy-coupling factor transport system ATP-binding protein|nr:energy-coupling factor transporter ATPase [Lachnospiraceae bacterium]
MALILDHVTYEYGSGTELLVRALDDVSLVIPDGQFIGLIGHTGSGKSTLVQHLNALLVPTSGNIYYNGEDIHDKDFSRKRLRSKVGLVFQYPEHQLFETDVFTDVCFGPKNLGLDRKETELRAFQALKQVGLPDECFYQSPFDLSGGQKRRAAIAGVLAMKPEVLILDEPTAGLDPKGRDEILGLVSSIRKESGMTVILVSHSMDDVAEYVDRIIVMSRGGIRFDDEPKKVFAHKEELEEMGLSVPQVTDVMYALREAGWAVGTEAITIEEAKQEILKC